jgi:hypothetical protein
MTNSPNTLTVTIWGKTTTLEPKVSTYSNGRTALEFWYHDEEIDMMAPYAKVTVNLPDQHLNEGELFVKDWAENAPLVEALEDAGWLVRTGREVISGYVAPAVMRPAGPLTEVIDRG